MSIASGIPRASLSRPGANNRISIQCRLEDSPCDGNKGHLWSQTVMPLYSEETGMSLSGS